MKIIRGTRADILSQHLDIWQSSQPEDVFCSWSESHLQEQKLCTCGQVHVDMGWDVEDYLRVAYQMLDVINMPAEELHISPHRADDFESLLILFDIDPAGDADNTLWGARIRLNPDIGSDKIRVRSANRPGVPLREIEFSIPWE